MKILYIITQGEQGGAQKNVVDIAKYFGSSNTNEVIVATGVQKESKDNWVHDSLGHSSSNLKKHVFVNLVREISLFKDIKASIEIYKYVKQNKIDIAHLHSTKAGIVGSIGAKMAGAKVVYTVHGFVFKEPMNIFKKLFYIFAEIFASLFIDKYILVSEQDFEIGKKLFIIRKQKGVVIYSGLDMNQDNMLSRNEAREFIINKICEVYQNSQYENIDKNLEFKLSKENLQGALVVKNKIIIGNVANLYKTKGLEYFIEAINEMRKNNFNNLDNILIVIFGEGSERAFLESKIKEYDLQDKFILLGRVPDASKYLKGLDLFVSSSVKEGLPYNVLEAAKANLPIIATNVGGLKEISRYINIQLVESKNVAEMANLINKNINHINNLEKNTEEQDRYKTKLHEIFTLDKMLSNINKVYSSLL